MYSNCFSYVQNVTYRIRFKEYGMHNDSKNKNNKYSRKLLTKIKCLYSLSIEEHILII